MDVGNTSSIWLNVTKLLVLVDLDEEPKAELLDYAEIILLICMVAVGGPLNVICFCRSVGGSCPVVAREEANSILSGGPNHYHCHQNRRRRNSKVNTAYSSRSLSLRLHLTVANLFIIWFYAVSQICWLSTYAFLAGDFMCRLIKFLHTFCFYSTSNIVVMIAIDRVYVTANIERPAVFPERSNERCFRFVVCWVPWILAFVASAPQLFVWNVIAPYKDRLPDWYQCVNVWVTWKVNHADEIDRLQDEFDLISLQELIYGVSHLILVFWCPAFIVICSYAVIVARFRRKIQTTQLDGRRQQRSANIEQFRTKAAKLHYQMETGSVVSELLADEERSASPLSVGRCSVGRLTDVPIIINVPQFFVHAPSGSGGIGGGGMLTNNVAIQTLSRVKRRTIRTAFWITLAYVVCWSPYNLLELWRFLDPNLENRYLELLSNLIVLNAVINPLIYKN